MHWPKAEEASAWIQAHEVPVPVAQAALKAAGARPDDAMNFLQSGRDPAVWVHLCTAMSRGDVSIFKDWSMPQVVDALQKLCHDLTARQVQAPLRFFELQDLGPQVSVDVLTEWNQTLVQTARTVDHPYNAGLMLEALVSQAKNALNSGQREKR